MRPLGSLWSILAKWQFVNRLPNVSIANLFLSRSVAQSEQGADLRLLENFRMDALAEHSGLHTDLLASSACCPSTGSRTLGLANQHLRFCGACMQEGFHATLFLLGLLHLQCRLVLGSKVSPSLHRRVNLPKRCVHDGQQMQARKLTWQ